MSKSFNEKCEDEIEDGYWKAIKNSEDLIKANPMEIPKIDEDIRKD